MAVKFKIEGVVNEDGSWGIRDVCENGQTANYGNVVRLLSLGLAHYSGNMDRRVLTAAEWAVIDAESALPDGWEPTQDGINISIVDNKQSFTRTYKNGDQVAEAPCGPGGESIPATRAALLAV